jgi:putative addiction module component (TIGR02574 family)
MAIRPELREELLKLSAEERQALADDLYESLEGEERTEDPNWEQAWSKELIRRVQEVAEGRVAPIDADDVHAELREELANLGK